MDTKYSLSVVEAPKVDGATKGLTVVGGYRGIQLYTATDAFGLCDVNSALAEMNGPYQVMKGKSQVETSFRMAMTGEGIARLRADESLDGLLRSEGGVIVGMSLLLPYNRIIFNPPKDDTGGYITDLDMIDSIANWAESAGRATTDDGVGPLVGVDGMAKLRYFGRNISVEESSADSVVRALEGGEWGVKDLAAIASRVSSGKKRILISHLGRVESPELRAVKLFGDNEGLHIINDLAHDITGYSLGVANF